MKCPLPSSAFSLLFPGNPGSVPIFPSAPNRCRNSRGSGRIQPLFPRPRCKAGSNPHSPRPPPGSSAGREDPSKSNSFPILAKLSPKEGGNPSTFCIPRSQRRSGLSRILFSRRGKQQPPFAELRSRDARGHHRGHRRGRAAPGRDRPGRNLHRRPPHVQRHSLLHRGERAPGFPRQSQPSGEQREFRDVPIQGVFRGPAAPANPRQRFKLGLNPSLAVLFRCLSRSVLFPTSWGKIRAGSWESQFLGISVLGNFGSVRSARALQET